MSNVCPACKGSGFILEDCPYCRNSEPHELPLLASGPCKCCDDTGYYNDTCPICEGTGIKKDCDY